MLLPLVMVLGCIAAVSWAEDNKFIGKWRPAVAQDNAPGPAPKGTAIAFELTATSIVGRDGTFPVDYDDDGLTAHLYVGQIYETTCELTNDDSMTCSAMGGVLQTAFVRAGTSAPAVVPR